MPSASVQYERHFDIQDGSGACGTIHHGLPLLDLTKGQIATEPDEEVFDIIDNNIDLPNIEKNQFEYYTKFEMFELASMHLVGR